MKKFFRSKINDRAAQESSFEFHSKISFIIYFLGISYPFFLREKNDLITIIDELHE